MRAVPRRPAESRARPRLTRPVPALAVAAATAVALAALTGCGGAAAGGGRDAALPVAATHPAAGGGRPAQDANQPGTDARTRPRTPEVTASPAAPSGSATVPATTTPPAPPRTTAPPSAPGRTVAPPAARSAAGYQPGTTVLHIGNWSRPVVRGGQSDIDKCQAAVLFSGPDPGKANGADMKTTVIVGHDFCGFDKLAPLPTGTRVTIDTPSGTLSYHVYANYITPGQGGPDNGLYWGDLTLQTCVGPDTGFSYLTRDVAAMGHGPKEG